ncbi:MAG: 23S rRNA (guanosine(2251)-2'-O)-methyltransferase RlmB [Fervidobacterium sp.]|uniref:23S rRNA (guanosine(2251)-2'-O)-methyltransferase RlmB n=1 Tax=Fervidobacterium sp. TaxID=1871331 RepID=UPI00404B3D96
MIVYGRNVLRELLLSSQPVKMIYFSDSHDKDLDDLIEKAKEKRLPFTVAPKQVLKRLCGEEKNQGVVIDIGEFKYYDDSYLPENPFIVLLDQVQDPQNLGSIVRTCVAAGVDMVVLTKDNSAHVTPGAIKASAGTIFRIPIVIVVNLARYIEKLKEKGVWIYGAHMQGKPIWDIELSRPLGIVLGNEGSGIRQLVKESCDDLIAIPMKTPIDSLNVSVSAGIIIYEVLRREMR